MLGTSLRHHGVELLRRVPDLRQDRNIGSPGGIPLLHPWANRIDGTRYAAGSRRIELDSGSPMLQFDGNGLPIHGVPWSKLSFQLEGATDARIAATLDWSRPALLAVFPFRHSVRIEASLDAGGLTIQTRLHAREPTPISFGFHPYFGLPGLARGQWHLRLPPMQKLELDPQHIPTGRRTGFAGFDAALGAADFDDGFAVAPDAAGFSLAGAGRRITLELLEGYGYAQVYAPPGQDYISLEPMTAPTNALQSGDGLRILPANDSFEASFRIGVEELS